MLANPQKLRSVPVAVRFTERDKAAIDWAADAAGVSPALFIYQLAMAQLAERLTTPVSEKEQHNGSAA